MKTLEYDGTVLNVLERLEELEDRELLSDPEIMSRLEAARADHLAGRVISYEEAMTRLGIV